MSVQIYGPYDLQDDAWPFEYVISALQFFAFEPNELEKYLPKHDSITKTLFHGYNGDFYSTSPFRTILNIYSDIIHVGIIWNEWINDKKLKNKELESLFRVLYDQTQDAVFLNDLNGNVYKKLFSNQEDNPFVQKMKVCRETAIVILKHIGLYEQNTAPFISCVNLLNEYSDSNYKQR